MGLGVDSRYARQESARPRVRDRKIRSRKGNKKCETREKCLENRGEMS